MGYARVFWVREQPIREHIAAKGRDEALTEEVGRRILSLSVKDSFQQHGETEQPLPLFDTASVFFPLGSFHSTDFRLLLWTGRRLCALPEPSTAMFDTLSQVASAVGVSHLVLPISRDEYYKAIGGGQHRNQLEQDAHTSVYWIYEDFTREFKNRPDTDWPRKEVGAAALNLMLSDWSRAERIRNCGNAISRCCSLIQPDLTVLVWVSNCLRLISEIEADELQRLHEWLARE